jgi:hypothetical protein
MGQYYDDLFCFLFEAFLVGNDRLYTTIPTAFALFGIWIIDVVWQGISF